MTRGVWLAAVVAIMFAISLAQGGISYTMAFGPLRGLLPRDRSAIATVLVVLRFGLVALMAAMWALRRKRALFRMIVIANTLFTLALLVHTSGLIAVLYGGASEAVNALLVDVVLMAASNILNLLGLVLDYRSARGGRCPARRRTVGFPLSPTRGQHSALRILDSSLWGLSLPSLHNELRVQPVRNGATDETRQVAHAATGGHLGHHIDRNRRRRNQYPRRRQMREGMKKDQPARPPHLDIWEPGSPCACR